MTDLAREFMKQNFYYTHLKGRLEKGYEADFKNGLLIVGSSHALCGIDESKMTETVVSAMVYVPFAAAILCGVVGLFTGNSMIRMFAAILFFLTLALWGFTQAGYIVNVFMGIDGNSFSLPYILSFVGMVVPMILNFTAAVARK